MTPKIQNQQTKHNIYIFYHHPKIIIKITKKEKKQEEIDEPDVIQARIRRLGTKTEREKLTEINLALLRRTRDSLKGLRPMRTEHPLAGITLGLLLLCSPRRPRPVPLAVMMMFLFGFVLPGLLGCCRCCSIPHYAVEPRELAAGVRGEPEPLPGAPDLDLGEVLAEGIVAPRAHRHFHLRRRRCFQAFSSSVVITNTPPLIHPLPPQAVPVYETLHRFDLIHVTAAAGEALVVPVHQFEPHAVNGHGENQVEGDGDEN